MDELCVAYKGLGAGGRGIVMTQVEPQDDADAGDTPEEGEEGGRGPAAADDADVDHYGEHLRVCRAVQAAVVA